MDKQELKSKAWYRFLKVIYIIISIIILGIGYIVASQYHYDFNTSTYIANWGFLFSWIFWQFIIELIIYKVFLYIVIGKSK